MDGTQQVLGIIWYEGQKHGKTDCLLRQAILVGQVFLAPSY
jgi:hypothetical protein